MRLSITLSAYVGRQFLFWFFSTVLILALIILLFDLVELIRRTSKHEQATFDIALSIGQVVLGTYQGLARMHGFLNRCFPGCFGAGQLLLGLLEFLLNAIGFLSGIVQGALGLQSLFVRQLYFPSDGCDFGVGDLCPFFNLFALFL